MNNTKHLQNKDLYPACSLKKAEMGKTQKAIQALRDTNSLHGLIPTI
jgi:hypothetical protein